jgi:hypothetical protein
MRDPDQTLNRPATSANAINNAKGDGARRRRWKPARAAAWAVLEDVVAPGARVAVAGAGNGDDLPLGRIARRAERLDLIDLDARALAGARKRVAARGVRVLEEDLTGGAADAVLAGDGAGGGAVLDVPAAPVGEGPYDVVVCDLVLTQLLYPALKAAGTLSGAEIDAVLLAHGQRLTDGVVARLWASTAPGGVVVIVHDLLGWWKGHQQPFDLDRLVALGATDPAAALKLARTGSLPYGCDPWLATRRAGGRVVRTAVWRWPFSPGADYVVFGLVTERRGAAL